MSGDAAGTRARDTSRVQAWALVAVVLAGCALALAAPLPDGWTPQATRAGGLTLLAIFLWATGIVPMGVTALTYFLLAMLLDVQPPAVVFSGFHSGAFWLVFAGMVIGVAVKFSGLGEHLARAAAGWIGGSYLAVLCGVALAALLLMFLMPSSMGRVLMMVPIVLALADRFGFVPGRPGRTGIVLVGVVVTFVPSGSVLTALVPNLVMVGAAENLYGIHFTYAEYLWIHFPVMGLLRAGVVVLLAWWLFRDRPERVSAASRMPRMGGAERQVAVVLVLALLFWVSDAWHGVAPAWVGLAAALFLLLPGLRLVPPKTLNERIDYNSVLYTAAVLGMGAVIAQTGLAAQFGGWFAAALPLLPGADAVNVYLLTLMAALSSLLVTNPAVPAVYSPLAGELAAHTGMPVALVLHAQVAGFSNVILPYSASPVLVGTASAGIPLRDVTRLLLLTSAVTFLVLLPLEIAWWQLIGRLG